MRRTQRSLSLKDCYAILDIPRDSSLEEVKHAYRVKAFELHPDLHPNDSTAGKRFQLLNEAYVALSAVLKDEEARASSTSSGNQEKQTENRTGTDQKDQKSRNGQADAQDSGQKRREQADRAYAEQDVLRDLLNDPFARRVFEDIYSELNRKQAGKQEEEREEADRKAQAEEPGPKKQAAPRRTQQKEPSFTRIFPRTEKPQTQSPTDTAGQSGMSGMVRNWLRRQIDEEQTLYLPAAQLVPGRRLRLQITHGLSGDVHNIEVTLPTDFTPGKPIRLRGLGKHVGPWQGDLYLTIKGKR